MFRKILIAAVASLALLSPLAMPAASDAAPVRRQVGVNRVHRHRNAGAWRHGRSHAHRRGAYRARGAYRVRHMHYRANHRHVR
jgi:Ni/Co efflux regulator RcnB